VRPLRVLVVDDSEDNRESLSLLLEQLGHRPTRAADGPAALQQLQEGDHDLALVDIGLPEMDGYEVARRIRAGRSREVYLVALTGYGQPEDRERSRAAGFDDHLTKPVDFSVLLEILARVAESQRTSPQG